MNGIGGKKGGVRVCLIMNSQSTTHKRQKRTKWLAKVGRKSFTLHEEGNWFA